MEPNQLPLESNGVDKSQRSLSVWSCCCLRSQCWCCWCWQYEDLGFQIEHPPFLTDHSYEISKDALQGVDHWRERWRTVRLTNMQLMYTTLLSPASWEQALQQPRTVNNLTQFMLMQHWQPFRSHANISPQVAFKTSSVNMNVWWNVCERHLTLHLSLRRDIKLHNNINPKIPFDLVVVWRHGVHSAMATD